MSSHNQDKTSGQSQVRILINNHLFEYLLVVHMLVCSPVKFAITFKKSFKTNLLLKSNRYINRSSKTWLTIFLKSKLSLRAELYPGQVWGKWSQLVVYGCINNYVCTFNIIKITITHNNWPWWAENNW